MDNEADGLGERLRFIEELVDEQAVVDGDVLEIDEHTWAIHGSIGVDGEVIMAEFAREEDARTVLDELRMNHGPNGPSGS
jgi:hypothetical protein